MLFNKIFGAVLATLLAILGIKMLSDITFGKAAHHGGHHGEEEHSINEVMAQKFAYYVALPEDGGGHGGGETVAVFDLGAELAAADVAKGEKSFRSKCSSCHTVDDGGPNGTGPNLHDVVGRPIASHAGFGYSGAMQGHAGAAGDWSYEHLNTFLTDPKGTVPGTAMAFAGLRKDPERMDVIAFLASLNPAAPAFPAPLPAASEEHADGGEHAAVEGEDGAVTADVMLHVAPEGDAAAEGHDAGSLLDHVVETVKEGAEAAGDAAHEAAGKAEDAAHDLVNEHTNH